MERMNWTIPGTSVPKFDELAFARMKAKTINDTPGNLTDYDCPHCLNRGYTMELRKDASLYALVCDCMVMRKCIRQMKQSGLGDALERMRFDSFHATEDWQKSMLELSLRYAGNPEGWLFLSGQPGCGKTHLCTAVCRELLLKGNQLRYLPWQEEIGNLRFRDGDYRLNLLQELKTVPFLYIDDLFKTAGERPTSSEIGIAFSLLNARYMSRLPTILSCEYSLDSLMAIDQATASRIGEMSQGTALNVRSDLRRNYRLRKS